MKKLVALLAATFSGALTLTAATPVAVWDGDFSVTQTGYTLNLNDNTLSSDKSTITISQNVGVTVTKDEDTFSGGFTVLVRYSDLNTALADKQVLATSTLTDANDRTGVTLNQSGKSCGIWDGGSWNSSGTFNSMTSDQSSGVLAFMHYSTTSYSGVGTKLFSLGKHSAASTTIMNAGTLGSNNDINKYKSIAIGGRSAAADGFSGATGMKISGIAVFSGILTEQEMLDYRWPTDVSLAVDEDTSVSALNLQLSQATRAFLSVADGVELTLNEEFAIPVVISSVGSVSLSAASQPDASYFSNVNFNIQGALLRSWLTPGVAGFNFRSANGSDVSGALIAGENWIHDNNSANGTSTAMFADGLSTLTWASANTWACSGSTIISGYLDDGANGGNGATVKLSNVPYGTYDVVVYCSSDSNPGAFLAKTVNGTTYTWDSSAGAVVEGNSTWGKAALSIPVYGVNALRIKNLSGALTIYGTARNGSNRGGIAAIQIMPPDTPDNIRIYTLTLDGAATTWSSGVWTLEGNTVDAPTSGNVKIVASASTVLTVDSEVNLADLVVTGAVDAVVNVATNGIGGSLFTIKTTVAGGVFQQGSPDVLGATPTIVVEDGATFDLNGFVVSESNAFSAKGAGAGNWLWALTSSGGEFPVGTFKSLSLAGNTTIGGANKINWGKSDVACTLALNGYTLTKIGAGELAFTNVRCKSGGTGTIDIQSGVFSVNTYCNLDGSNADGIYATTKLILREGAEYKNSTDRTIWVNELEWLGGTITATRPFGFKSAFTGAGTIANVVFDDGAVATLTGNLEITGSLGLSDYDSGDRSHASGSVSLVKDASSDSVVCTVSGTFTSGGAVSVGAGVTLDLGENRPTATLTVDAAGTLAVQLQSATDVIELSVSAQPANVALRDANGEVVSNPRIRYSDGTLTIMPPTPTLVASDATVFDTAANWESSGGAVPSGGTIIIQVSDDSDITVNNDYAYDFISFYGNGQVQFTGNGSISVSQISIAPGVTAVMKGSEGFAANSITGEGSLVLNPGSGQSITLAADNSGFTGALTIESGIVKMGNKFCLGARNRAAAITVRNGAVLDLNGTSHGADSGIMYNIVLEEGATYANSVSLSDTKMFDISGLILHGNATVDASQANIGVTRHWHYQTTIDLGEYTLTKIGEYDMFLSQPTISGSGTFKVAAGTVRIPRYYSGGAEAQPSIAGTLEVDVGAAVQLDTGYKSGVTNTVNNLVVNGEVKLASAGEGAFRVTGSVSGTGTVSSPLVFASGATFKPTSSGYLVFAGSLTLNNGVLTSDVSDIDFDSASIVPLFKVSSAEMLPEASAMRYSCGELPKRWSLEKTTDGLGYRLKKFFPLSLRLR
jgi:hypothetical protein